MRIMKEQQLVSSQTSKRGYKNGWSEVQFLARQVCKLQEELGELAELFVNFPKMGDGETNLEELITDVGKEARRAFDDGFLWGYVEHGDIDQIKKELADMQVVLFNAASAVESITGQPYDIVQAAVDKATADVKRGVR